MDEPTRAYEGEGSGEEWFRQMTLPEEYLLAHYPTAAGGYCRRFESPNVIDLVLVRRRMTERKTDGFRLTGQSYFVGRLHVVNNTA
jgi:hypothetical protein